MLFELLKVKISTGNEELSSEKEADISGVWNSPGILTESILGAT